jgi:acyl-CoA thioesterase I
MKRLIAALGLPLAACGTVASPTPILPPLTALAGSPCNPPIVIPVSIVGSVTAQFDVGRTSPPPVITDADRVAYQAGVTAQRANDWANLCYYRAANAELAAGRAERDRVVFMGDSITQSWGLAEPAFFGPAVVNRGISGQTTPQMLLRFRADVLGLRPAAAHIMAGVNDVAGNTGPTTLEDIEGNIASMVELAKAHDVTVILATVLPAATFNWAPQLKPADAITKINAWIRTFAADQNLVLADYYPALATPGHAMKPELSLDGVHPNKAGYAALAPIAQAAIRKALHR